jgi:uncharacterized protein
VCGDVPYYLERFNDACPLREHLLTEVFERTGLLHDEAELMLRQSIPDPANHIAVLRSIAHGYNRNNEISGRTGLTTAQTYEIVGTLERLGLASQPISLSLITNPFTYTAADLRQRIPRGKPTRSAGRAASERRKRRGGTDYAP